MLEPAPVGQRRRPHSLGALPSEDESLPGYIFRLARRRRMRSGRELLRLAGLQQPTERMTLEDLQRLAYAAEVPVEALLPLSRGSPRDSYITFKETRLPVSALDRPIPFGRKICQGA
jgi:hypothetical protein